MKEIDQIIKCSVNNCKYNCKHMCTLSEIKIANISNTETKESTICDSFKAR